MARSEPMSLVATTRSRTARHVGELVGIGVFRLDRQPGQNWYMLPFEERSELMSQHGRSGMKFAGRVTQLITASTGLDNWEWGVTLWGRNPTYLKDIVYTMRFDESSARYALFGDFYFGYILPPNELFEVVRL